MEPEKIIDQIVFKSIIEPLFATFSRLKFLIIDAEHGILSEWNN